MNARQMKSLRKKYALLKEELLKKIKNSDYEVDMDGDDIDALQGASLLKVQYQITQKNMNKLRAVEKAMDLIDAGEYGDCEECGETIGIKRLEAMPGVTMCITCAEQAEFQ